MNEKDNNLTEETKEIKNEKDNNLTEETKEVKNEVKPTKVYLNQKYDSNPLGEGGHVNFFKCDREGDKAVKATIELLKSIGYTEFEEHKITYTSAGKIKEYGKDLTAVKITEDDTIIHTFEVKYDKMFTSERNRQYKNNKLCIEIENFGKPSGLMSTTADYWVHYTDDGIIIVGVDSLKKVVVNPNLRTIMCGDKKASKCVFVDAWTLRGANARLYVIKNNRLSWYGLKDDLFFGSKTVTDFFNLN